MKDLLAIDPGIHTGWAYFDSKKQLSYSGHGEDFLDFGQGYGLVIIERPQVYPTTNAKQANNLITLALQAGKYAGMLRLSTVEYVLPSVWKGQIPKAVHHARGFEVLSPEEAALYHRSFEWIPKGYHEDVKDAINLGLWKLGRLPKQGRATPSKT